MTRPCRVLLLEPNRFHALLISRTLAECATPTVLTQIESPSDALRELTNAHYHVLIVSCEIEHGNCEEFLRYVRGFAPEIFIVALSSESECERRTSPRIHLADHYVTRDQQMYEQIRYLVEPVLPTMDTGTMPDEVPAHRQEEFLLNRNLVMEPLALELGNPLMTILGAAELLCDDTTLDPNARERARIILESAERMRQQLAVLTHFEDEINSPNRLSDTDLLKSIDDLQTVLT